MPDEYIIESLGGLGTFAVVSLTIATIIGIIILILRLSIPFNLSKLKELQNENNVLLNENNLIMQKNTEYSLEIIRLQGLILKELKNKTSDSNEENAQFVKSAQRQ